MWHRSLQPLDISHWLSPGQIQTVKIFQKAVNYMFTKGQKHFDRGLGLKNNKLAEFVLEHHLYFHLLLVFNNLFSVTQLCSKFI